VKCAAGAGVGMRVDTTAWVSSLSVVVKRRISVFRKRHRRRLTKRRAECVHSKTTGSTN